MDPLSLIVPELSDEHKTVREIPLNSPGREPRRLGEARQLAARKPLQHGTPKLRANQPLPGEAREHPDRKVGEPVALDIGDHHRPLGEPRKSGEEPHSVIKGEIVQHGRQDEVEAVRAEGQVTRIGARAGFPRSRASEPPRVPPPRCFGQ